MHDVVNTLVIETAFLGDVIISLGVARELKRLSPQAGISYLIRPDAVEIVRACPDVDEVIPFDKRGAESGRAGILHKATELNARHFDTIVLLHSSPRSQALCSMLHAPMKVGFSFMSKAGLTQSVEDHGWNNRYERALMPLKALFEHVNISTIPRLLCPVPDFVTGFTSRFPKTVAIAPGSVWATKKWGDVKYALLASQLSEQGMGIILVGSETDRLAADRIEAMCQRGSALNLAGRTTLAEAGGAIAGALLLIANDSAPSHLAVAVGTQVISIFGPTVPAFGFAPPEGRGEAIEAKNIWCRPCTSHGSARCPIYTHECMEAISVPTILERITNTLPL
jgi:heptosyltransferase II